MALLVPVERDMVAVQERQASRLQRAVGHMAIFRHHMALYRRQAEAGKS